MSSLLDIHKYSKKAFQHLLDKLRDDKFKRPYIYNDKAINAVTGILWDITQGDKELKEIIEGMDKIDRIKAEKSRSRLEKITSTWLEKAHFESYKNGYKISRNYYLKFIKSILKPNTDENENILKISGGKLFDKIYQIHRNRLRRVSSSPKLQELKERFPEYDIEDSFKYAVITGKFNLNADDMEKYGNMIELVLLNKKQKSKKPKVDE